MLNLSSLETLLSAFIRGCRWPGCVQERVPALAAGLEACAGVACRHNSVAAIDSLAVPLLNDPWSSAQEEAADLQARDTDDQRNINKPFESLRP